MLKNQKKSLPQWLEYLEQLHPSEIDLGLVRVQKVAAKMKLLKPAPLSIMVAGTNGKGSSVALCTSILQQAKMKVGSYMSPHLHIYNERVRINGKPVSDDDLIESFEAINEARAGILLTYFEVGTLSALYVFLKHEVDAAVLEVGLGGRLDAVNIVDADVSVVTSIGIDHQDWLGDDLSSIAFEKAGIYRAHKAAICGERNPQSTLVKHAEKIAAPLFVKGQHFNYELLPNSWHWSGLDKNKKTVCYKNLPIPSLPIENAATVLQALQFAVPELDILHIKAGLELASLPGRLQQVSKPINAILDVGHNPQAAGLLAQHLSSKKINGKRFALLAMLSDKDPVGVVTALAPYVQGWHLAGIDGFRGQTVVELDEKLTSIKEPSTRHENVWSALDELRNIMNKNDELLILGSFATVATAQNWIKEKANG